MVIDGFSLLALRYLRSVCSCCDRFQTFIIPRSNSYQKGHEFTFHLRGINERNGDNLLVQKPKQERICPMELKSLLICDAVQTLQW